MALPENSAGRDEVLEILNRALGAGAADNPKASLILTREIARLGGAVKPIAPPDRRRAVDELRKDLNRIPDAALRAKVREALVLLRENKL